MKLHLFLVAILLIHHAAGTSPENHENLRSELDDENYSIVERFLTWGSWGKPKQKACRIESTDPTKFREVTVKKNRVAALVATGDVLSGSCEKNCNSGNVCPTGSVCDLNNGRCNGVCTPPATPCSDGESCICACGDEDVRRSLTWAGERKVQMCHVISTNPTTFRNKKVRQSKVKERIDLGDLRGTCQSNCEELCPDEFCNLETGKCEAEVGTECTGPRTCPGKKCECTCVAS